MGEEGSEGSGAEEAVMYEQRHSSFMIIQTTSISLHDEAPMPYFDRLYGG